MAAYDAVSSNVGTGTSISVSHTTAVQSNRLMLIWVFIDSGAAFAPAVTVDAVSATLVVEVETSRYIGLFRFIAPSTGANTVDVTSLPGGGSQAVVVETFYGVDQDTPLGTPTTANAGTSSPPVTINISSATDDIVADALSLNNTANALSATGTSQTARYNADNGSHENGTSTKPGESTAAMTWDWTSAVSYAHIAVNVRNAPGAAALTWLPTNVSVAGRPASVVSSGMTPRGSGA